MGTRHADLGKLCDQFHIDILCAYGSQAKEVKAWLDGTLAHLSTGTLDVDIGVKPARGIALNVHQKVHLALAVEELFKVSRVDLVSLQDADPFLAANIIRGERLFCRDEYLADEYDLYILRRAEDLVPLERERLDFILKGHQ